MRRTPTDKALVPDNLRDTERLFHGDELRALLDECKHSCSHPLCDTPYFSLEAHHIVFHSRGGITRTGNGLMLCETCHRLLHAGFMPLRLVFELKLGLRDRAISRLTGRFDADELLYRVERVGTAPLVPGAKLTLLNDVLIDANSLPSFAGKRAVFVQALLAKAGTLNDGTSPVRANLKATIDAMNNRRAWAQVLARNAARYAHEIGDHWSAARAYHVVALCFNARNRFTASVRAHRDLLCYFDQHTFLPTERDRLAMFRARVLREMGVCMAKSSPRSSAALPHALESYNSAHANGNPRDIDDARIRCCEAATFVGEMRQAEGFLADLHANWSRMDANLRAITTKLAARLALAQHDNRVAWEAIEEGKRWCESKGIHHQAYHFARLAWNLEARIPDSHELILT